MSEFWTGYAPLIRLEAPPYPRLWLSDSFLSSRSHNARRRTSLRAPCFSNCGEGAQKRTLLRGHIAKLSAARFRHSIPDHGLLWLHEVEIHRILSPDIITFVANKRTIFDISARDTAVVIFSWVMTFILIIIFPCGIHIDKNWGTAAQQEAHCLIIGYTSLEGLATSNFILDGLFRW